MMQAIAVPRGIREPPVHQPRLDSVQISEIGEICGPFRRPSWLIVVWPPGEA